MHIWIYCNYAGYAHSPILGWLSLSVIYSFGYYFVSEFTVHPTQFDEHDPVSVLDLEAIILKHI